MTSRAIILFGHGSRDPLWRQPMDAVAARIAATAPQLAVRCAFLELQEPDLATAALDLVGMGARELTVVPMFLGTGKHAREDLPLLVDAIGKAYPDVQISLRAPVGEDPRVLDVIAAVAIGLAQTR